MLVASLALGIVATPAVAWAEPVSAVTPSTPVPVTFAVLGDSITTGQNDTLELGMQVGTAYPAVTQAAGFELVGGVAHDGYTSHRIRDLVQPVDADYLVIMIGTNDLKTGWNTRAAAATRGSILEMQRRTGVSAAKTVMMLIPPSNRRPALTQKYNAWLRGFAAEQGMQLTDPWRRHRAATGRWSVRASHVDGVHPTPATSVAVGRHVASVLSALEGRTPSVSTLSWPRSR